ncbi:MAG: hypothetical protein Q4E32_05115 [Bacteroidales bacterium]|nr:hypothetical protein [Bacteroidales bacterium]
MKISITKQFQKDYDNLWKHAPVNAITKLGYGVIDHLKMNDLLFVGLNPAYNKKSPSPGNCIGDIDTNPKTCYSYFKPFYGISKRCGFGGYYSFLDILAVRHTRQADVKDLVSKDSAFKDFCQKQFDVFKEILCTAQPRIIVVCNAYAREWMTDKALNKYAFELYDFDDKIGTYRIKSSDSRIDKVPVFFSGMFSGQHALDKGSLERLEWHIRITV